MPSLNVPGYIPTTVVQKQPKMWQQALAQILTGVASQAAGQAVGNTMSRDYAGEYGETAATGWDKLASGPKVGKEEHGRRQAHAMDKEKMLAQLQGQLGLEELRAKPGAQEEIMKGERALTASDARMQGMQDTIAKSKMNRGDQNARRDLQQSADNNRIMLEQIKAALEQADPGRQADARVKSAQATFSEKMNEKMFPSTTAIPGADGGGISEAQRQFAAPLTPRQQTVQNRVQEMQRTDGRGNGSPFMAGMSSVLPQTEQAYTPGGPGGGVYIPEGGQGSAPAPSTGPSGIEQAVNPLGTLLARLSAQGGQSAPAQAQAPQVTSIPPQVNHAAAMLANGRGNGPEGMAYKAVIRDYLNNSGNDPYTPESVAEKRQLLMLLQQ